MVNRSEGGERGRCASIPSDRDCREALSLSRGAESVVPPRESVTVGTVGSAVGQDDSRLMQLLQAVPEHGAVGLIEYIAAIGAGDQVADWPVECAGA